MKTSRFTDSQIIAILKQAEGGSPVLELCREHGTRLLDRVTKRGKIQRVLVTEVYQF